MYLLTQETCPRVDDIRFIPLTQGQFAKVLAKDYDWLNRWKWYAVWNKYTKSFYAQRDVTVGGVRQCLKMHRVILGLETGNPLQGDHADKDTLNNCRENLRPGTISENARNRGRQCNNKSGFKGVSWSVAGRGWLAQIVVHGVHYYLGIHLTPELAYAAYCEAAQRLHGAFARTG